MSQLTEKTELFKKEYDGESIVDLYRDIGECIDGRFNPLAAQIPEMENFPGFAAGTFTVSVTWTPDE